jgi:hypothetical protein
MTPKWLEAAKTLVASGMRMREIVPAIGVPLYRRLPAPLKDAMNTER